MQKQHEYAAKSQEGDLNVGLVDAVPCRFCDDERALDHGRLCFLVFEVDIAVDFPKTWIVFDFGVNRLYSEWELPIFVYRLKTLKHTARVKRDALAGSHCVQ